MSSNNKVLGKGLAELFGENNIANINDLGPKENRIINIELVNLEPSKYQPRKSFDENYLQELAVSIKEKGVLQPILIKEVAEDRYEIIAGERRWRASKIAGLDYIPAIILDIDENGAREIALIENIQREQLSPIEEANAIGLLIKNHGYTHDKLSSKIGKSRSHITNMLRLLSLPQEVQELLDENKISMGHARALISDDNPLEIAKHIVDNKLSVRDTESYVQDIKKNKTEDKKKLLVKYSQEKKEYFAQLEGQIHQSIGFKTRISHNGKKGKILIQYGTISELEEIIGKLSG